MNKSEDRNIKICFVSPYSYPLFNEDDYSIFGGAEVRARLFGGGLSEDPRNQVSFIVLDDGRQSLEEFGRVKVYRHSFYKTNPSVKKRDGQVSSTATRRSWKPLIFPLIKRARDSMEKCIPLWIQQMARLDKNKGEDWAIPSLTINHYKIISRKLSVYKTVNADIYCAFGASNFTAEVAAYCKWDHKTFVLFTSTDLDFSEEYRVGSSKKNVYGSLSHLCHYAVVHADLIITQTHRQAQAIEERFGKKSITIYNPIDLIPMAENHEKPAKDEVALWIGKADRVKRPEILLRLARQFGDTSFFMVMNPSDQKVFKKVIRSKPPNVEICIGARFSEVEKLFLNAFVLINTSAYEGFPNTFLQAGKYGVPILSAEVDPDGFISKEGCGIVAEGKYERFVEGFQTISGDKNLQEAFAKNIKNYVYRNHRKEEQIQKLKEVLRTLQ